MEINWNVPVGEHGGLSRTTARGRKLSRLVELSQSTVAVLVTNEHGWDGEWHVGGRDGRLDDGDTLLVEVHLQEPWQAAKQQVEATLGACVTVSKAEAEAIADVVIAAHIAQRAKP